MPSTSSYNWSSCTKVSMLSTCDMPARFFFGYLEQRLQASNFLMVDADEIKPESCPDEVDHVRRKTFCEYASLVFELANPILKQLANHGTLKRSMWKETVGSMDAVLVLGSGKLFGEKFGHPARTSPPVLSLELCPLTSHCKESGAKTFSS